MATNRRARQLERERLMRQAARRRRHQQRQRRIAVISGVVVVLIVLGVGGSLLALNSGGSSTPSSAATTASTCGYVAAPAAANTAVASPGLPPDTKATGAHIATIVLKQGSYSGTVTVALSSEKAPCTVNSFQFLAGKKFFDNTPCHRETATSGLSVLQCGDPTGTGTGGPGYSIPDENLTGATYPAGTVAMANSGPNTGGSQFFLVYKNSQLPASYTPFGTVTSGLDVLTTIAKVGQNNANGTGDGAPKTPVKVVSFRVS